MAKNAGAWGTIFPSNKEVSVLTEAMSQVGMPTALRLLLSDHVSSKDSEGVASSDIQLWLKENIKNQVISLPQNGVHVVCGPSGSRKSTIIAKNGMFLSEKLIRIMSPLLVIMTQARSLGTDPNINRPKRCRRL